MIALAMLAAVVAYVGVWYFIAHALPNWWARSVAVLAALAIPFWDVPYGYYNFLRRCHDDGGLRVLRQIPPQEQIYFDRSTAGTERYVSNLFRLGFSLVEQQARDGKEVIAYRKTKSGLLERNVVSSPMSRVGIRVTLNQFMPWGLILHEHTLFLVESGAEIARYKEYAWANQLQRYAMPILGRGLSCPEWPGEDPLIKAVLKGST